jgi:hypothetical protein
VFGEMTHNYGRVRQGVPVEHIFNFANQGGVPLTIMELRAACDSEATLIGPAEIAAGDGGGVRLRFDTTAAHGPQRRTVTVYSNDPAQRAIVLSMDGDVALDVAADPPQVYLGSVPPGATVLREVALLSGDGARFAAAATDAPQLSAQVIEAANGPRLLIGTTPGAPLGPFAATIRVPTTSAMRPVLRIDVAGTIAAPAVTSRPAGVP